MAAPPPAYYPVVPPPAQAIPMQQQPNVVHVTTAPTIVNVTPAAPTMWRHDIFKCCDHVGLCLCVSFVPFASCYVSNKVLYYTFFCRQLDFPSEPGITNEISETSLKDA